MKYCPLKDKRIADDVEARLLADDEPLLLPAFATFLLSAQAPEWLPLLMLLLLAPANRDDGGDHGSGNDDDDDDCNDDHCGIYASMCCSQQTSLDELAYYGNHNEN